MSQPEEPSRQREPLRWIFFATVSWPISASLALLAYLAFIQVAPYQSIAISWLVFSIIGGLIHSFAIPKFLQKRAIFGMLMTLSWVLQGSFFFIDLLPHSVWSFLLDIFPTPLGADFLFFYGPIAASSLFLSFSQYAILRNMLRHAWTWLIISILPWGVASFFHFAGVAMALSEGFHGREAAIAYIVSSAVLGLIYAVPTGVGIAVLLQTTDHGGPSIIPTISTAA